MIHSLSLPVMTWKTGRKLFLEWWSSNIFTRFNKMHFIIFIFTKKSIKERIDTVFGFLYVRLNEFSNKGYTERDEYLNTAWLLVS